MAVGGGSEKGLPRAWASSRRAFHAAQAWLASVRPSSRNLLSRSSAFRSNHFFMPWASTIIALPVSVVTGGFDGGMVAGEGDFGQGGVGGGGWGRGPRLREDTEGEGGATAGLGWMATRFFAALRYAQNDMWGARERGEGWVPAPAFARAGYSRGHGPKRKGAGHLARPLRSFR